MRIEIMFFIGKLNYELLHEEDIKDVIKKKVEV